jgi:hypothetical protein
MIENTAYDEDSDTIYDWSKYLFDNHNSSDLFLWKLSFCNRKNLINVGWGEWKMTGSPKRILGTWGLFDCVGLAASADSGRKRRRFLAHMFATPKSVRKNFDGFYRFMDQVREPDKVSVVVDSTASFSKPFLLDAGAEVVVLDCLKQVFGKGKKVPLHRSITMEIWPDGQILTDRQFAPSTIVL